MAESTQTSSMAQATSYGQQGAQGLQQAQQAYGQHSGNSMMNQGENYSQSQTFAQGEKHMTSNTQGQSYGQGENNTMNSNQEQKYGGNQTNHAMNGNEGPNSAQDYYNQKPNEMTETFGQQYGNGNGNYQQSANQQSTSGMNGQAGQSGKQYPDSKAPDMMHVWLDKIEKKFGGERFDESKHPENAAKNKALNENIIKKLTQVMKIVMQRGPQMAMQYGSKLF